MLVKLQYGRADSVRIPLIKRAVADFAVGADWTPAAGDVKVSVDGATAANIGTLPTATAVGNAAEWLFTFTAAELSGKRVRVAIADAATKAVEDDFFIVTTMDHPLALETNGVIHYGVAAGGGASAVTLTSGNANYDNFYRGGIVRCKHGGLSAIGTLAKSAVAEKYKTTTTMTFYKNGAVGTKTATDNLVFSAAHTVNNGQAAGTFWGAFLIQYDGTSAFSSKVVSSDQVYASESAALVAARALVPDSGTFPVGFITINSKTNVKWTANTDDMTAASDCTSSTFYDAYLIANEEEWKDVASYVASTGVVTTAQAWSVVPMQSVDEVWIYGAPYPGTSADLVDLVWDEVSEGTETIRQSIRLIRAGVAGKRVKSGTTQNFRDVDDSKNRIAHVGDGSGSTTSIVTDAT